MAATITATVDTAYVRVRVDLSGWSADGPITVMGRSGQMSWQVRSITTVSGGVISGYDYEMPLSIASDMQPITYSAYDGSALVTSSSVTVVVPDCASMLRAPGLPALDVDIEVIHKPEVEYPADMVVLTPLGRETGIPLSGALSAGRFDLAVRTRTELQAVALMSLLRVSRPTVLAIIPGTRLRRQYVATGTVQEAPFMPFRSQSPEDGGDWSEWTIPCTVVDRPAGRVFGDPTASYQAGLDQYPTYQASLDAQPDYLDRLKA